MNEVQQDPVSFSGSLPSVMEMMEVQKKEQKKWSLKFSSGLLESSFQLFQLPSMKSSLILVVGFLLVQQLLIGIESTQLMGEDGRIIFYSFAIACLIAFKFLKYQYLQRVSWILNFYSTLLLSGCFDSDASSRKEMRQFYDGMALALCFWVQGQHAIYDAICLTICFLFMHLLQGVDAETALLSIVTAITFVALKYCSYLRDRQVYLSSYLAEYWSETAIQSSFVQVILFSFEKQAFQLKGTKASSARFNQFYSDNDLNKALETMILIGRLDSPSTISSDVSSASQKHQQFKNFLTNVLSGDTFKGLCQKEQVLKGILSYHGYKYKFTVRSADNEFKMFLLTLGLVDPKIIAEKKQEKDEEIEQYNSLSSIFLRNYRKRFQSVQQLLHKESMNPKRVINTIQRTMESLKYQTTALQTAVKKAGYGYKQGQILSTHGNEEEVAQTLNKVQQDQIVFDEKADNQKIIKIDDDDQVNFTNPRKELNDQTHHQGTQKDDQISEKNTPNQGNQNERVNNNDIQIEIEINEIPQQKLEEVKIPIENIKDEMAANKVGLEGEQHTQENINNEVNQEEQPSLLRIRQIIASVQQLYTQEVDSICNVSEDTCITAKYSSFHHMLFGLFENCLAHSQESNLLTSLKFNENTEQRLVTITMTILQQPGSKSQRQQLISPERQELFLETHQSNFSNKNNKESENNNNIVFGNENNQQNNNNNNNNNGLLLRYLNGVNHEQVLAAEQEWLFQFLEESKCKQQQISQQDFQQFQLEWNAEFDDTIPREYLRDSEKEHHQTQMMQQQLQIISSDTSSFFDNIQEDENNFDLKSNLQNHDMAEIKANKEKIQNMQKQQGKYDLEQNKSNLLSLGKISDQNSQNKLEIITFQERETKLFRFEQESDGLSGEFSEPKGNGETKQNNESLFSIQKLRNPENSKQESKKETQKDSNPDEYDYDMEFFASNNNNHYDDEFYSETKSKGEQKALNPGIEAYNTKFKTINDCPH